MARDCFRFDDFVLDPHERSLTRAGEPVDLSGRYLDALVLLVREQGRLVTRERFFDEVWSGVPVSDEALTQAIRTLRRTLGDKAGAPRFIATVPKHGYRFLPAVESFFEPAAPPSLQPAAGVSRASNLWRPGLAGALSGGLAGLIGGLVYGFAISAGSPQAEMGATSILMVLLVLTGLVGLAGGAGIGFAVAATRRLPGPDWIRHIAGGALGGLVVGALFKLVALDAFALLLGAAPRGITGAGEGAVLGAMAGFAAFIATARQPLRLRMGLIAGAGLGGGAGLIIFALGGALMGGSLDALAQSFPDTRLRMDALGALFGETGFGPVTQAVTMTLEGALFGAFLAAGLTIARRRWQA